MVSSTAVADAGTAAQETQWVVFLCGGSAFGFPLQRVIEITTPRPFTRLPGAGAEVCGLVGIRGRVITVLDLGMLLGTSAAAAVADHRLLLLDAAGRRVGAVVDEVLMVGEAVVDGAAPLDYAGAGSVGRGRAEEVEFTALEPGLVFEPVLSG